MSYVQLCTFCSDRLAVKTMHRVSSIMVLFSIFCFIEAMTLAPNSWKHYQKIKSVIFSRDRVSLAPKCTVLLLVSHKYRDYRYVPSDPAYTVRFQIQI